MSLNLTSDDRDQNFKALYFEYYAIAFRTAMYILKQKDAAEDVAQNVFLKLWDKREQIDQLNNPKAYIIQMARNGALDTIKKAVPLTEENLPLEYVDDIAEDGMMDNEFRLSLEKAVSELSPKCRLVFSLSRFEGLTNPEIAEHLDISIRTVETQISNALKAFRTDLRHFFIEFLGWGLIFSKWFSSSSEFFL